MGSESTRITTAWVRLVGWIDSNDRADVVPINEVRHAVTMAIRAGVAAEREQEPPADG